MIKVTIDIEKQIESQFEEYDFSVMEIYEDLDEEYIIFSTEGKKVRIKKSDFYRLIKVFQPLREII